VVTTIDDGLYGSYSGQLYDHARYPVEPLRDSPERLPSVLAGPTCDSIDVIAENLMFAGNEGRRSDRRRAMGAYTWASASEFNCFPKATVVAVNTKPGMRGALRPSMRCRLALIAAAAMLALPALDLHAAAAGTLGKVSRGSSSQTSMAARG